MSAFLLAPILLAAAPAAPWEQQTIATDADFRGLSAVGETAWVSGTKGTVARTADAGKTWAVARISGAETLDLRDIEAVDANTAYAMSAGPGEASRIYKTTDAGKSWKLLFQNTEPTAFFDAIAFWDAAHGIAVSDPVDGKFLFVTTDDGGATWTPLPVASRPVALPKEGAFAASGTCLIARGEKDAWFCTGGAERARLLHSTDRGRTWREAAAPFPAGAESAGAFSVAFDTAKVGIIVGGDYRKPDAAAATGAITRDGGATWAASAEPLPYRSAVAWAADRWVAVGPTGSDESRDGGATWQVLDKQSYNAVAFTAAGAGWAAGPKGRVAKFVRPAR